MKTAGSLLFVYGTLRRDMSLPLKDAIASDIEWVCYGQIKGRLYDIGNYPGAVRAEKGNSIIKGEMLQINNPVKVFMALDIYEGCDLMNRQQSEYYRQEEIVQLDDGTEIKAWVYWYNLPVKGKRRIRNQDYLKYLRKKQLA